MKLRPLGNRVIVKPASKEEKTLSGIILPDTMGKERPEQGDVIEVGPGLLLENGTRQSMSVKVGDRVIFKKYSPDEFKIESEEYLVLAETDIIAVLEK
jgi:chaperonin GroES